MSAGAATGAGAGGAHPHEMVAGEGGVPEALLKELRRTRVSAQDAGDVTNTLNEMLL